VPVRVHVRDQADEFKRLAERFETYWTPTTLILIPTGKEVHRIEGFLAAEDFLAHLMIGVARAAFSDERFAVAERMFGELLERFPKSEVAPEALYWKGVARYKATEDKDALTETARSMKQRFAKSPWATRASVWA
jgi:hypothetical protein